MPLFRQCAPTRFSQVSSSSSPSQFRVARLAVSLCVLLAAALSTMPASAQKASNWYSVPAATATDPVAGLNEAIAYYPETGNVVMFGGAPAYGAAATPAATCLWNGSVWSCSNIASGPSARQNASMAYDSVHKNLVLFGGLDSSGNALSDTWTYDTSGWHQQSPASYPPARYVAAMATQPAGVYNGGVVLFGGTANGTAGLSDTWTWNGSNWTASASTGPSARFGAAMVLDGAIGSDVLFGGGTYSSPNSDTWLWNGSAWTSSAATGPSARLNHTMAYDNVTGAVVLFGGFTGGPSGDTWSYTATGWTQLSLTTAPPARFDSAMAYDAATASIVLFGGAEGGSPYSSGRDTWLFGNFIAGTSTASTVFVPTGGSSLYVYNDDSTEALVNSGGTFGAQAGAAIDSSGNVWSVAYTNDIYVYNDLGTQVASYSHSATGLSGAFATAMDGANTLWMTQNDSNNGSVFAINNAGTVVYPSLASGNFNIPISLNIDAAGSLWIANQNNNTITEVIGVAAPVRAPVVSQTVTAKEGAKP